jgi:hypothetical protein
MAVRMCWTSVHGLIPYRFADAATLNSTAALGNGCPAWNYNFPLS